MVAGKTAGRINRTVRHCGKIASDEQNERRERVEQLVSFRLGAAGNAVKCSIHRQPAPPAFIS